MACYIIIRSYDENDQGKESLTLVLFRRKTNQQLGQLGVQVIFNVVLSSLCSISCKCLAKFILCNRKFGKVVPLNNKSESVVSLVLSPSLSLSLHQLFVLLKWWFSIDYSVALEWVVYSWCTARHCLQLSLFIDNRGRGGGRQGSELSS